MHQPQRVENAKILIANTPMDTDKIKVFGSRVKVDNVSQIAELELAEKEKMKEKVDMICSHDMNVFINRQLIYNYPEQLFADKGVMAIEHADFDGIERLALVTGGEIVSTFGHPDKVKIGKCDLIEQVSQKFIQRLHFVTISSYRCPLEMRRSSSSPEFLSARLAPLFFAAPPSRLSERLTEVFMTPSASSHRLSRSQGLCLEEEVQRC